MRAAGRGAQPTAAVVDAARRERTEAFLALAHAIRHAQPVRLAAAIVRAQLRGAVETGEGRLAPAHDENKLAQASASWLSGGCSRRQVMPQAALSNGQSAAWAALAGHIGPWFPLGRGFARARPVEADAVRGAAVGTGGLSDGRAEQGQGGEPPAGACGPAGPQGRQSCPSGRARHRIGRSGCQVSGPRGGGKDGTS